MFSGILLSAMYFLISAIQAFWPGAVSELVTMAMSPEPPMSVTMLSTMALATPSGVAICTNHVRASGCESAS